MKVLKIHDEIEVNEDAERMVLAGVSGMLCCAPGLGLWAGRHLFYAKQYEHKLGMQVFPIVGEQYSHEDMCLILGVQDLLILHESLFGIDPVDLDLLQKRIGVEIHTGMRYVQEGPVELIEEGQEGEGVELAEDDAHVPENTCEPSSEAEMDEKDLERAPSKKKKKKKKG